MNTPIHIESNEAIQSSEDALDGDDPLLDRNYTELNLNGISASNVWNGMVDFANSLGALNNEGNLVTDKDYVEYDLYGPNSNSTITSVLSAVGIDIYQQLPYEEGTPNNGHITTSTYPGLNDI